MEAQEYIRPEETNLVETDIRQTSPTAFDDRGTLICTDSRLVFDSSNGVTDIRLDGIVEMQYSPPSYWNRTVLIGLLTAFVGIVFVMTAQILSELPNSVAGVSMLPLLIGLIIAGVGIFAAKNRLVVKTSQSTYRFSSSDKSLEHIAHAVRGSST